MGRPALLVVYLAVFVDMLGFGIILPLLPFHTEALGGTGVWVGGVLTAYAAAQFVSAPILGALSDRFGRRPLLLASLAGSAISLALTGVAGALITLLLARVVAGAFGGAIAVGQAYVVDLTEPKDRTKALGMVGASIGMGFVFGPGIGGGLAALGLDFAAVSFVAGGVALANLIAGYFLLPRLAPGSHPLVASAGASAGAGAGAGGVGAGASATAGRRRSINPLAPIGLALKQPGLRPILGAVFAATLAFVGMEATYALLGERLYDLGPTGLALIFTGVGVVMAIVQGGVVGRAADRFGDRNVAIGGALLLGLGLAVLPFSPMWLGYLALCVLAVGQGLLSTTTAALIATNGGASVGGAFGVGQSAASAARAIGPLIAGAAFDAGISLPYLGGAALCLVAVLFLRLPQTRPAAVNQPA